MSAGRGFTLIELLISIAMMILLVSAITMIFVHSTETIAIQEARMTVYTNARYALDSLENDLLGAFPAQGGLQRFWMNNGVLMAPGNNPTYSVDGGHHDKAGDALGFRSTTIVADTMMTCEIVYELMPGDKAVNEKPGGMDQQGDSTHQRTARTDRGLYTLVRRVRVSNPKALITDPKKAWDFAVEIKDRSCALIPVVDQEICHYVVSFNLEYLAVNGTFSQLQPSPFPKGDPLGDGAGPNDLTTPYRVPAIRVTIVIVDDNGERQERMIQKTLWIPQM